MAAIVGSGGIIHPANDMPINEIDIDTTAKTQGGIMVTIGAAVKGRAQIVPVSVTAGITVSVIGLTPDKQECFSAHPSAGHATQDRTAVHRIEGLEALRQADLTEIRRTLGGSPFGQ